jgi:hypothetical protein
MRLHRRLRAAGGAAGEQPDGRVVGGWKFSQVSGAAARLDLQSALSTSNNFGVGGPAPRQERVGGAHAQRYGRAAVLEKY